MSGDDPKMANIIDELLGFYPHERGWSRLIKALWLSLWVLPAWAGMILVLKIWAKTHWRFTRMSGDDPKKPKQEISLNVFYPHERGWSLPFRFLLSKCEVLPAWAGMILSVKILKGNFLRFTRMSGDDPIIKRNTKFNKMFYPHERGWS